MADNVIFQDKSDFPSIEIQAFESKIKTVSSVEINYRYLAQNKIFCLCKIIHWLSQLTNWVKNWDHGLDARQHCYSD